MALLVVSSETTLTDVSDASGISPNPHTHDHGRLQNQNDDELNSKIDIQNILIETEKNLQIIIKINNITFDKLVNELQLSLLKQLKQALNQLKINASNEIDSNNNSNNNTNNKNEEKQGQMVEYHERKSQTDNLNVTFSSILDVDSATVVSTATAFTGITKVTGVSSIAPPI